jgi:hypothetical protein
VFFFSFDFFVDVFSYLILNISFSVLAASSPTPSSTTSPSGASQNLGGLAPYQIGIIVAALFLLLLLASLALFFYLRKQKKQRQRRKQKHNQLTPSFGSSVKLQEFQMFAGSDVNTTQSTLSSEKGNTTMINTAYGREFWLFASFFSLPFTFFFLLSFLHPLYHQQGLFRFLGS